MVEMWRPVKRCEEHYLVSTLGKVKSRNTKELIIQHSTDRGYKRVNIVINGKRVIKRVHILVLETFRSIKPQGMECRHLNGVKDDNRLINLVWGTPKENTEDKRIHGTLLVGEESFNVILTEELVKEIRELYKLGRLSQMKIAKIYNVSQTCIFRLVNRISWKHI